MATHTHHLTRLPDHWATISKVARWAFPPLLFWLAFLPRAIYPVARSTIWHFRAKAFIQAIVERDWAATLLAPHPGVPTMWLVGIANRLGEVFIPGFDSGLLAHRMAIEILPLALVIALSIVLAYFLLRRLLDDTIATVGSLLLALDPFHITISKTVHVDALMSVFAMLSALWLLTSLHSGGNRRWRDVILSAIFAALALLSKSPALFLAPYLLLCLGSAKLSDLLWPSNQDSPTTRQTIHRPARGGGGRRWLQAFGHIAATAAVWALVAALIYALLYPALWVHPGDALSLSFGRVRHHATTPHPTQVLFLGQTTLEDPGPLFYPVSLALKTTEVSLPFFLLAQAFLFSPKLDRRQRLIVLLADAFVLFFVLQMTLGEKKSDRYILPAFPFLDFVAGYGAVYAFRWLARGRRWLLNAALALVVAVQFTVSIPRHPYYGTHYNRLVGSPKAILERGIVPGQEQAEGLDIAAAYLNRLPMPELLVVGAHADEFFRQYFVGKTVPLSTDRQMDYLVFARNDVARGRKGDLWMDLWEMYRERPPKLVVSFDGVPYAWVYKAGPPVDETAIQHPVYATLGQSFHLLGYDLQPSRVRPGESIHLTLYWETMRETPADYTVFIHLLEPDGTLHSQRDSQPQSGLYPTFLWSEGERVIDEYELTVAAAAPAGVYRLALGMYELASGERLPITDCYGTDLPDRALLLDGPEVIEP